VRIVCCGSSDDNGRRDQRKSNELPDDARTTLSKLRPGERDIGVRQRAGLVAVKSKRRHGVRLFPKSVRNGVALFPK
jgi:hypothetical protein